MRKHAFGSARRLFGLLCLFAGVPLVLIVVVPLQMGTRSLGREATDRVSETATVSATAISLEMQGIVGLTQSFASRPEFIESSGIPTTDQSNPVRQLLDHLQDANPNVRTSFLLDAAGHLIANSPFQSAQLGRDLSYRDYYKGAIDQTGPFVSGTFMTASTPPAKVVAVSIAIRGAVDATGSRPIVGILGVSVDVTPVFQSYVDNFQKQSGVSLRIIDQRNQEVAAPGLGAQTVSINEPGVVAARAAKGGAGTHEINGEKVVIAYQPVQGTNWVVSASVPHSEAFAPINKFRARVLAIAMILGSVVCLALGLLFRSIRLREKTSADLQVSEERTRKVVETVRQGFIELDTDMKITDWNAQAEVMTGWTREEILDKSFIDTCLPEDRRDVAYMHLKQCVDEPGIPMRRFALTGRLLTKNDEDIPVDVSMWATEVNGRRRVNIFAQDISERVRLDQEQELVVKRQRVLVEELRAADKAKSDFISTISHELRTPLTSIVGYLEMLTDGYGGELTANQTSMLEVIDRNSRRLLSLIEDVLTLSRIESGAYTKSGAVAIDVSLLVQGAVQTFVPSARAKSLELDVDVPKDIGWIHGDHSQLERVLLNLISNAVKFTPEGGRVTLHGFRHGDTITISVSDTGIGIPIEEQHKLFSRFFRSSTAQDRAIQGTGLGLTIVKSIVERHGGTITIQSAAGAGTMVMVEFPAMDSEAVTSPTF